MESTILACLGGAPRLLRPGAIAKERIEAALGIAIASEPSAGGGDAPIAPGLLTSHYAPRAALRLAASRATREEAALDFGGALASSPAERRLDLSPSGDLDEAAANLFAYLRALDATGAPRIAVAPIPERVSARRSTTGCAAPPRRAEGAAIDFRRAAYRRGGAEIFRFLAYPTCAIAYVLGISAPT